jgi:hypothetical protein
LLEAVCNGVELIVPQMPMQVLEFVLYLGFRGDMCPYACAQPFGRLF